MSDFFLHATLCGPTLYNVHALLPPQLKLAEHQTTPPGYLTESELITLMEKHGIGTVSGQYCTVGCIEWAVLVWGLVLNGRYWSLNQY